MKKGAAFVTIALAAVLLSGLAFAAVDEEENKKSDAIHLNLAGVRNLTRATLDDVRQGDWLLVIVAQWCGFSRNVVSKLSIIAHNLRQTVQVAVIDGEEDPSIHIQFSLDSYPFICYVHDGAIHVYDGVPEWNKIIDWAKGDWKSVKPLEGPRNPFGWQMTVIGATTHFFWAGYDFVFKQAELVGLTAYGAFSIIFGAFTVIVLIIVACCVARYDETIVLPLPDPAEAKKPEKKKPEEKPKDKKQQPKTQEKSKEEKPKEEEPKEEEPAEEAKPKEEKKKETTIRKRKTAKRLD